MNSTRDDNEAPVRTMADIARIAGVAESTVSRALSGSNRVSEVTRDRIREIVGQQGYKINARARSLRTRKTGTVEVVIPISETNRQHFSDPFFSEIIAALADALAQRGLDMLLSRFPPWSPNPGANAVAEGRADGIIMIGQGRRPEELETFAASGVPLVVWGAARTGQNYPTVGSDNRKGGELVGRHLAALGRRRIAFLGDIRHVEIGLRHEGCMGAFTHDGDDGHTVTVATPFDGASAYRATADLIAGGVWHDAIFAASDVIAIAAMQALRDAGLRVPQDVTVIGYDDIMLARYSSPALTTVRQDARLAAEHLVGLFLAVMNGEEAASVILPTELIVRHSCGG